MFRMGRRGEKGFTLIELLVVVSIIAMLIALLLPALGQARATAKNSQCLSHQRQIAVAAMSYAADHGDFLPSVNQPLMPLAVVWNGQVVRNPDTPRALLWYLGTYSDPTSWKGLSRLYVRNYIGAPRTFYCPSMHNLFRWHWEYNNTGANPWLSSPAPPNGYVAGYYFNGHTVDDGQGNYRLAFPRAAMLVSNRILNVDVMYGMPGADGDWRGPAHYQGAQTYWNATFGDGHVDARRSGALIREMMAGSPTTEGGWGRLNRHLNYLADQTP